jgi:hypothetical protein
VTKKQQQQRLVDAVVEIVHQGYGRLIDGVELYAQFIKVLKPHCSANYEYVFTWNHECDPKSIEVNWKRLNRRVLRRVISRPNGLKKIAQSGRLTAKEKERYRLAIARQKYGCQTAEERLQTERDLKWVDLSFLTDSRGRQIYLMEIGDADTTSEEEFDSLPPKKFMEKYHQTWQWRSRPLTIEGPFASVEEAEAWMDENGAFDDE